MTGLQLSDLLEPVMQLAYEAGRLIESELNRPDGPRGSGFKADVDVEIEVLLRQRLKHILNCDFVGEETGCELSGHPFSWVVDPHDGTGDFLNRRPGSAISIGLLHNATPVLGVVYAPVTPRGPDCIAWAEGVPALLRNSRPVENDLQSAILAPGTVVMVSYGATQKAKQNALLCDPASVLPMTSIAYRLARVAAGDGVAAVSLYSVSPHDLVASHALLRAVNGDIWNEKGEPVRYATPQAFTRNLTFCFGGAPAACSELLGRPWHCLKDSGHVP